MKKIIAVLLLSAAFAAPAFAENNYYAGVQVGNGIGILGGLQIDKIFSVEADYTSYSNNSYFYRSNFNNCGFSNCSNYVNASSLGIFGVGTIPLQFKGTSALSAFGKIGIVRTAVSASYAGVDYSRTEIGLGAGVGAEYDFHNSLAARAGVDVNSFYSADIYIGGIVKF